MALRTRVAGFAALAATASLLLGGLAFADDAIVDADGVLPVSTAGGPLALGNLCLGSTITKDVLVAVERGRGGGNGNAFADGSVVTFSASTTSAGLAVSVPAPGSTATITLPSTWSGLADDTVSAPVKARVSFQAATAGTVSGKVRFTASGTNQQARAFSRAFDLTVTATVASCDTTPPTLNLPAPVTVEATGPSGAVVGYTATATDANPSSPAVTCTPASGSTFPIATTTVNCSATDAAGNVANGSFTVRVQDTVAPTIAGTPSAFGVEATGAGGATVTYAAPTATDAVDGSRLVACIPASGSTLPLGPNTITCTAADTRGNGSSSSFVVTVSDTTDPSVVVPGPTTAEATGPGGAAVSYTAAASDTVSGTLTPVCGPASGSTFALGQTSVTCTATDGAGNSAQGSFTVTVEDTTAPTVTVPDSDSVEATGPRGATVNFADDVSATDTVDGAVAVDCTPVSGASFPIGATTVTCTATDAHDNIATESFTVTVVDETAPVLNLPQDFIVEATTAAGATQAWTATATDVVDGSVLVTCAPISGSTFALGSTTVDCEAEDAVGNKATGSFTVTVRDTTAPVLDVDVDDAHEATGPTGATVDFSPSATDAVDDDVAVECNQANGGVFPVGTTSVTCTATDDAGNTATSTFEVVVLDTTAPTIGDPDDLTIEATGGTGATVTYTTPAAEDVVDTDVQVTCEPPSGSEFPLDERTTVTCTAVDDAGNEASSTFDVLVQDTTEPLLSLPGDMDVEATGPDGATVTFTASATDVVDGPLEPECEPPSGATFPLGPTSVGCSAVDAHRNQAQGSFTVTVVDTTPPVLDLPDADVVVEATSPDGAVVGFTATATDLVDGDVAVDCAALSGTTFPLGTTTVECSATDRAGNTSAVESFDVVVRDTTAPVVDAPEDLTLEATGPDGAALAFTASATDAVSPDVAATCTPPSGSTFPLGATTVTCAATDGAGNSGSDTFTVTVVDTTAPALTLPTSPVVAEATGPDGATVSFETGALDFVDGAVVPTCTPAAGSTFALGTTPVECSVRDRAGNEATASFDVTVRDTTAPSLSEPSNLSWEATGPDGAVVTFDAPTATDLVDGDLPVTCDPASGSTYALGTSTVTCTATDEAGNTGERELTVTVLDTTAPVLAVPAPLTLEATGPTGAVGAFSASASDLVDGAVAPQCVPPSGSTFALGETTTVTCTATDTRGNTSEDDFTVTVVDTTPPAMTVPADQAIEAIGPSGAPLAFEASAVDLVDGAVPVTCSAATGDTFAIGSTVVTCSATDEAGNEGSDSFTVTVEDTTAPALTVPAAITTTAVGATGAPVTYSASATDIVDGVVTVTCVPAPGATFAPGTTRVDCSAADGAGNRRTASFTVSVLFDHGPFLQPVNPAALNTVKNGSTVPLKWQVRTPGGGYVTTIAIVNRFTVVQLNCGSLAAIEDPVDITTTGGTTLRYDTTSNQFIQNWQTPRMAGTCFRAQVTLVGGQVVAADFRLK